MRDSAYDRGFSLRLCGLVCPLFLAVFVAAPVKAQTPSQTDPDSVHFDLAVDLGEARRFNGFFLESFAADSLDIEGRLAAGSDVSIEDVVLAGGLQSSIRGASLLVGEELEFPTGSVVRGDILIGGSADAVGQPVIDGLADGQAITANVDLPFSFDRQFERLRRTSSLLAGLAPNGEVERNGERLGLLGDCDSPSQVFEISSQELQGIGIIEMACVPADANVVVNVAGSAVQLSELSMPALDAHAHHLLFNFHDAGSLSLAGVEFQGTVLAPDASVSAQDAVINGTLIARAATDSPSLQHVPYRGFGEGDFCPLYPLAVDFTAIDGADAGTVFERAPQGVESGNFSWLTWAGNPNAPTLADSLLPPGDSYRYINPDDDSDGLLTGGDWAQGAPGVMNSSAVRDRLDALVGSEIIVPAWSEVRGQGNRFDYRIEAFARIRVLDYRLSGNGWVTFEFLDFDDCYNQPPEALPQSLQMEAGGSIEIELAGGDPNGDELAYTLTRLPEHGQLAGDPPLLTYTPNPGFAGTDSFEFVVEDAFLASAAATVTIEVIQPNRPPQTAALDLETLRGEPVDFELTGTDADGDPLTFEVMTPPMHGSLQGTEPLLTYLPDPDFVGVDQLQYVASDGESTSAPSTVSITVIQPNRPPEAVALTLNTLRDVPVPVILDGSDPDGDALTFEITTAPTNGLLQGQAPDLTYVPAPDFVGVETFEYVVRDGEFSSPPALITISVSQPNRAPSATPLQFEIEAGDPVGIELLGQDPDGDPLTFTVTSPVANGSLSGSPPALSYQPAADFVGVDQFEYVAFDGELTSVPALVTITVIRSNLPPAIVSLPPTQVAEGEVYVYPAEATDDDGDPLTFALMSGPDGMVVDAQTGRVEWTADGSLATGSTLPNGECRLGAGQQDLRPSSIDAVMVMDGSGSNVAMWPWVAQSLADLNADLQLDGVGAAPDPNRFGLVWFGSRTEPVLFDGEYFGPVENLVAETYPPVQSPGLGSPESGLRGLQFTVDTYPFREDVPRNIVLVPDEPEQRGLDNGESLPDFVERLRAGRFRLNVITQFPIQCLDGRSALGLDADGRGYVADGAGGFEFCAPDRTIVDAPSSGYFSNFVEPYVLPALDLDGAVWSLSALLADGAESESLRQAITSRMFNSVVTDVPARDLSDLAVDGIELVDDASGRVRIAVRNRGLAPSVEDAVLRVDDPASGLELAETVLPSLAPGEQRSVELLLGADLPLALRASIEGASDDECTLDNNDLVAPVVGIEVADPDGATDDQYFAITVTDVNEPPVIVSSPTGQAAVGQSWSYPVAIEDPDRGDAHRFEYEGSLPATIDAATGELSLRPTANEIGTHAITVRVSDLAGAIDEQSFELSITGDYQLPAFLGPPDDGRVIIDQAYRFTPPVTADATAVLEFSLLERPDGMSIDVADGTISWTPPASEFGRLRLVTLGLVDQFGNRDALSFVLFSDFPNTPPEIVSTPSQRVEWGRAFNYIAEAQDANAREEFTFELETGADGIRILTNPTTPDRATISWDRFSVRNGAPERTAVTDFLCRVDGTPSAALKFGQRWTWGNVFVSDHAIAAPLEDTNGDGVVDHQDAVVVLTHSNVTMFALDARTGQTLWSHAPADDLRISSSYAPAVADLDGDGAPEIYTVSSGAHRLTAWSAADRSLLWQSTASASQSSARLGRVLITDLEGDGRAEILAGPSVFDDQGVLRFQFGHPFSPPSQIAGSILAVDLDDDGQRELLYGDEARDASGNLLWVAPNLSSSDLAFWSAADFDGDGSPELVQVARFGDGTAGMTIVDASGVPLLGPIPLTHTGRPVIGDMRGDGALEIFVPGENALYSPSGERYWQGESSGFPTNGATALAADLQGNGRTELLLPAGAVSSGAGTVVLDGLTGAEMFTVNQTGIRQSDRYGMPVLLDTDGSGTTRVLTTGSRGVSVSELLGPVSGAAPRFVHQTRFAPDGLNADLGVNSLAVDAWRIDGTDQVVIPSAGAFAGGLPDLRLSLPEGDPRGLIDVRVSNRGTADYPDAFAVQLWAGDPDGAGVLLAEQGVSGLALGASQSLSFANAVPSDFMGELFARLMTPAAGPSECSTANNRSSAYTFDLTVTDHAGATGEQDFLVGVYRRQAIGSILGPFNVAARELEPLVIDLERSGDSDTSSAYFYVENPPAGLTQDGETGRIEWTPQAGQAGEYTLRLRLQGLETSTSRTITVSVEQAANQPPVITSTPPPGPFPIQTIVYQVEAYDPEGEIVTYSLREGPEGMTLNADSGLLVWEPPVGDGSYPVEIVASDGETEAVQIFTINVDVSSSPEITSRAVLEGTVSRPYSYALSAIDADGDAFTFRLDVAPAGMTIDRDSGLIEWLPLTAGLFQVSVVATDTQGLSGRQDYLLAINPADGNRAPQIVSTPVLNASAGRAYTYAVQAADADGDAITFRFVDAPAGMTITGSDVSWTPAADQLGSHPITVEADDGRGGVGTQTYQLVVDDPNGIAGPVGNAPVILSTPPAFARAGAQYRYQIDATDADGDPLVYGLIDGPPDMIVDAQAGEVIWTPDAAGILEVAVGVDDGRFQTEQAWRITVADASAELQVVLTAQPEIVDPDDPVQVAVGAFGTTGEYEVSLTLDGVPVALDSDLRAIVTSADPGTHVLVATLSDPSGTTQGTATFNVRDPAAGSPPVVTLDNPDFDQEVTAPIDVIGSVDDDDLQNWVLGVLERGRPSSEAIIIAGGTAPVANGVLGQLDPTLLENGLYQVVLEAQDAAGNSVVESRPIRVTGDMKVGHFSLTFEDMNVPVGNLPVRVTRTYDTRQRHKPGDFGFGWTVDYQDVRLQESRTVGFAWSLLEFRQGFFPTWCVQPNGDPVVTVTLPDGEVESFIAKASPECTQLVPQIEVDIVFEPIDGTDSTLESMDFSRARLINGNLADPGAPDTPIDPDQYRLTTPEGVEFELDQNFGIRRVIEPNETSLTYTEDGITHSDGFALEFVRDALGRITDIVSPDGTIVSYQYDAAGNLVGSVDPIGDLTQYTYVDGQPHLLEDILDPRGVRLSRNEYDEDGRLVASIDADGNRIELTHDIDGRSQVIRDRRGNNRVLIYDDEGNVLSDTNALGETTLYEYDEDRNETAQVDALGHRTEWTYDDRGNPLTQTDPLGRTTSSTYDDRNGLLTQTDASGTVILANSYFSQNGNLRTSTDALGNLTEFHWDAGFGSCGTGTSEGVTDALGFRTTIQAKCDGSAFSGLPAWREDANGTRTTFTYDTMGRTLTETTTRTDANGVVRDLVTSYAYDDAGRVIATTDPLGHVTRTEYNPIGKQSATVDALGRRTEYEYDARGNLVLTRYPDGTIETSEYDPEGNVVAQTDRAGRTTRMVYDAANRLIETILPDETPLDDSDNPRTQSEYDAAGRMIASIDERGNRTEYEYDAAGQRTATIDALGHRTEFEYDLRGNRVAMVDARGHRTEYEYDAAGRQTAMVFPDGTRSETAYDALGRRISQTDPAGQTTTYEYDALGNLAAVVDALGQRTEYGYDEQSSKILQRDALGRETRWAHDDLGRVISRSLPLGQTETYGYDAVGSRTERVDFNGAPSAFQFDVADRLVRAEYADGQVETMTYTPTGQVDTVLDARGVTDYDYDVRDRLLRVTHPTGQVIEYAYDAAGNRVGLVTANQAVAYGFDALNRLATVDDGSIITTYRYDEVGNRQAVEHANGTRTDYVYDDLNRLLEVTHRDPLGTPFSRQTYTLGLAGHRLQMAELDGRFVDYTYDALYRLTEERVIDPVRGNRTTSWTFDDVGNRLTETENGQVTQYAYDANDRLEQEIGPDGTIDYVYDANGNTLEKRVDGVLDTAYVYDSRDRLVRADTGSATLEFAYDANGIRQSRTENGQRTDFLVDTNRDYAQVIEESGAGSDVLYLRGDDLIAQTRDGAVHTYHADGLGSTRALSDAGGVATDGYIYTAYGELEHREGLADSEFLYTGEQYETGLGFYYLRARYYDPAVGRFPTMDAYQGRLQEPATLHKYLYVHGDPINGFDPTGNFRLTSLNFAVRLMWSASGRQVLAGAARGYLPKAAKVAAVVGIGAAAVHVTTNLRDDPESPPMFLVGSDHAEVRDHILAAQFDMGISPIVNRKSPSHSRRWLSTSIVRGLCGAGLSGGSTGNDCDEFPMATHIQGGRQNFLRRRVSLRPVDLSQNRSV